MSVRCIVAWILLVSCGCRRSASSTWFVDPDDPPAVLGVRDSSALRVKVCVWGRVVRGDRPVEAKARGDRRRIVSDGSRGGDKRQKKQIYSKLL